MNRTLKWILGILVAALATVSLAAAALIFWIDPNLFRDDFERLAARQGVVLNLGGELGWRFWPELQIVSRNTSIAAPDAPTQPLAKFDELSVAVAVMPLLNKQVVVRGLAADGLEANLSVDKNGIGNWSQLGKRGSQVDSQVNSAPVSPPTEKTATKAATSSKGDEDSSEGGLNIGIDKLDIRNSAVRYRDARSEQSIEITNLNLSGENIALSGDGQPVSTFPLSISADLALRDPAQQVTAKLSLQGDLGSNDAFNQFEVSNSQIKTEVKRTQGELSQQISAQLTAAIKVMLPSESSPQISVLDVKQGQLAYQDPANDLRLSDISLNTTLLPGPPQAISLSANISAKSASGDYTTPLALTGKYQLSPAMDALSVTDLNLSLKPGGESVILSGSSEVNFAPLTYSGTLKLGTFNPRQLAKYLAITLPEMANPKALTLADASLAFDGNDERLQVNNLVLRLDASKFTGSATVPFTGNAPYVASIKGDVLTVDDYLPPKSESGPAEGADKNSGDSDAPIDLSALQDLKLKLDLKMGQLRYSDIPLSTVQLGVNAQGGKLTVNPLSGTVYDSPFSATATVDASQSNYRYQIQGNTQQLPVGQLLKDLGVEERLSGKSDVDLNLSARGKTVSAIENSLDGNILLKGKQFQFQGINVEKAFCRLVATVQGETFNAEGWPAFTNFSDSTTKVSFKQGVAKVEKLDAGVSRLNLTGEGKVNLRKSAFDMVFNTKLTGNSGEGLSCVVKNKNLLNRAIPIRCKSEFDKVGALSCLPDPRVAEDIAKEKIKDKVDEKAKEVIQEKLGTEKGEAAKQIFNQLFKKN